MLVDGLDITNGVSVTCREIAEHWAQTFSNWDLLIYGTSVISLKDENYDGACIRVEKSLIQIPVIGYKRMWLSIPIVELFKLFSSSRYQIVHSTTPGPIGVLGAIIARILGKPLILTHHTRIVDYMNYYSPRILLPVVKKVTLFLFRKFYSLGTLTIAHSPATVEELETLGAKRIRYIPMGVKIPILDINQLKQKKELAKNKIHKIYDIPMDKQIIMYIGRIAKEKNLSYLAEVSRRLKYAFIIVGDGPVKKSLKKYPNIILPGFKYGNELSDLYLSADLFVCTSTSETLGKTLLEALSHGIPILVPDEGYHNSILTEGKAVYKYRWGTKEQAIDNITKKISEIINLNTDRALMTEAAFTYALQFSWDKVILKHAEPYVEVTSGL